MFSDQYEGEYHDKQLVRQTEERLLDDVTNFIKHVKTVSVSEMIDNTIQWAFRNEFGNVKKVSLSIRLYKESMNEEGCFITYHRETKTLFIIKKINQ